MHHRRSRLVRCPNGRTASYQGRNPGGICLASRQAYCCYLAYPKHTLGSSNNLALVDMQAACAPLLGRFGIPGAQLMREGCRWWQPDAMLWVRGAHAKLAGTHCTLLAGGLFLAACGEGSAKADGASMATV